jgi:Na+-translocating ferredoxin:NAD+ oxidoreductase subunit E
MNTSSSLLWQGLWQRNSALVQLLGLCPLLAVSSTAVQAVGLGLATTLVLLSTNGIISLLRHWIPPSIRLPMIVLLIATVTTSVQLLIQAFAADLYQALGIFIPLIVTNCIVLGRAEAFALKNTPLLAALDGLAMGLGATIALLLLGSLREILGSGTLFQGAETLLGAWGQRCTLELFPLNNHFVLASLPPGAFLGLGLLLALKQALAHYWDRHQQSRSPNLILPNKKPDHSPQNASSRLGR